MLPATKQRPEVPAAPSEDDQLRCQWFSNGDRCLYAGTISPSTIGGGPWYCHGHFFCDTAEHGGRIVDESRRNVLDANHSPSAHVARSRRAFQERLRERMGADAIA